MQTNSLYEHTGISGAYTVTDVKANTLVESDSLSPVIIRNFICQMTAQIKLVKTKNNSVC